jgi:death-on-curing protein
MMYDLCFYTVTYTENDRELHKNAIVNFLKLFYGYKNILANSILFDCTIENEPYRIVIRVYFEENNLEDIWYFSVFVSIAAESYKTNQPIDLDDKEILLYSIDPWMDYAYWTNYIKLCMKSNFKIAQGIRDSNGIYNIKDMNAVEAIANAPFNSFNDMYNYPDVLDKAAIILYSIVKDHPFSDGNKRTAFLTLISFLNRCGLMILLDNCGDSEGMVLKTVEFMISIASSDPSDKSNIMENIKHYILENINIDTNFQNKMNNYTNKNNVLYVKNDVIDKAAELAFNKNIQSSQIQKILKVLSKQ